MHRGQGPGGYNTGNNDFPTKCLCSQPLSGHNSLLWNLQHSLMRVPCLCPCPCFQVQKGQELNSGKLRDPPSISTAQERGPVVIAKAVTDHCWRKMVPGQRLSAGGLAEREIKRVLLQQHISSSASVRARRMLKVTGRVNCFWNKCVLSHCSLPSAFGAQAPALLSSSPIPLHTWIPLLPLSGNSYLLKKFWNTSR